MTWWSRLRRRSNHPVMAVHRTITFWAPVSSGKTYLAAATALSLAATGNRVALLDLDVATPSLPRAAGYTLDDVAEDVLRGSFDPGRAAAALPRVGPVYLLAGPANPLRAELLSHEILSALLAAVAARYDVVICDTSRTLAYVATLAAIDAADTLILPVTPDELAAWHAARYLNLLTEDFALDPSRITLVLNHASRPQPGYQHITRLLQRPLAAAIPYLPRPTGEIWPPPLPQDLIPALIGSDVSGSTDSPHVAPPRQEGIALGSGH